MTFVPVWVIAPGFGRLCTRTREDGREGEGEGMTEGSGGGAVMVDS